MKKLINKENDIESLGQYYILQFLKKNLNIELFDIYVLDKDNMKVIDKQNEIMYFHYDADTRKITYQEKPFLKEKER